MKKVITYCRHGGKRYIYKVVHRVITSAQSETKAIKFWAQMRFSNADEGQNELVHKAFPTGTESLTALDILNVHKTKRCTGYATVDVEACAKAGCVQDKQLPSIVATNPSIIQKESLNTRSNRGGLSFCYC